MSALDDEIVGAPAPGDGLEAASDAVTQRPSDDPAAGRSRFSIKRLLPRTLYGRSLLIIVTPLIALQIVTTWIFFDRHWDTVSRRLANGVGGEIATVIDFMRQTPEDEIPALLSNMGSLLHLRLAYQPGEVLSNEPAPDVAGDFDNSLETALVQQVRRPFRIESAGLDAPRYIQVQLADGVLEVVVPRKRLFTSTTYLIVLWMVGSSLVLFAVASLFMRNQIRPIRRLATAAEAFGKGRDIGTFKIAGAREVRQAAIAFEQMRLRIRRQVAQRTEMLAGVSHDLRTPLTRMKLQLAMLPRNPETEELESDVAEMERMLEGYLAFVRGEGGELARPIALDELVEEVVGNARRQGGEVHLEGASQVTIPLRRDAFSRCLANVLGNALRHGSFARVSLACTATAVEVMIEDDGPGIPPERRREVFRPFVRLDRSRNPATGGIGLGLAIARDVVHAHGGEITLEDSPVGGLRVRISLPL